VELTTKKKAESLLNCLVAFSTQRPSIRYLHQWNFEFVCGIY